MHLPLPFLSLYLWLCVHFGIAQTTGFGTFPVDMGKYSARTHVDKSSLPDTIYRFNSFEYARITLATGFSPEDQLRFNYNLFTGEMDMIGNKGDTVTIKRLKELKFIKFADHLFLQSYKIGYIEVLRRSTVSLGVLALLFTDYTANAPGDKKGHPPVRYYKHHSYYFLDKDDRPYKTSSSSIRKLFYDQKKQVKAYIKQNDVDFDNKEHLINLLTFCDDISPKNGK
ncbi:MAG: hypothetical protein QM762_22355 [Chryseolinea sp.]